MSGGTISARLARVRFTVGYVAVLLVVSFAILALGPHARDVIIQRTSTNLHNLAHGHIGTLLGSAFVVDAGPIYFWLPFLTCLLVLAELQLRTIRLMVAFLIGHIGATLVVAVALAAAIEFGWLPVSIARASDVGMSYGALAVLGALTATLPPRWRPAWIGWWIAAAITAAIIGGDFTDAGHTVAVILGLLVSRKVEPAGALDAAAPFHADEFDGLRFPGPGSPLVGHGCDAGVWSAGRGSGLHDRPVQFGAQSGRALAAGRRRQPDRSSSRSRPARAPSRPARHASRCARQAERTQSPMIGTCVTLVVQIQPA